MLSQHVERLRRRHFVNEMQADEQLRLAARQRAHGVRVPDLLKEVCQPWQCLPIEYIGCGSRSCTAVVLSRWRSRRGVIVVHGQSRTERHVVRRKRRAAGCRRGSSSWTRHTRREPPKRGSAQPCERRCIASRSGRQCAVVPGRVIVKFRDGEPRLNVCRRSRRLAGTASIEPRPSYADFDVVRIDRERRPGSDARRSLSDRRPSSTRRRRTAAAHAVGAERSALRNAPVESAADQHGARLGHSAAGRIVDHRRRPRHRRRPIRTPR